ncbi:MULTISPECIES: LysR family transcriptional regulator [Micrococcaceae]|uniref:LysR family transcriptional regulator n=1 Tax=Micrococcaceae TaxID=1268 RepID=UPI0016197424|nr:LysR family transcriptional regulator [Citricoccus sp.]MBB5750087.1 DNA-binding transcriptional LysR family regulator [Micrococcus sp. TA1]HRO94852.1 LysR family transcriptional regulator [Citricoccus sp.]
MDTRWLEAFIAVAEELHFGRAASRLHMAHSPLSQMIRKLEREIGSDLFDRNTRSVCMTSAGLAFLPFARESLERLSSGRKATTAAADVVVGRVRIGYSGVLNHVLLPPLTRGVHQELPGVELELIGRVLTDDALVQLRHGALDLACVGLPIAASAMNTRLLYQEHLGAVLPADHRLAAAGTIDVTDLADEPFVTTSTSGGSALEATLMQQCSDAGFRPRVVQETSDPYVVLQLVAGGVGITLAPETIAPMLPPGAVYRSLLNPTVTLDHGLAWSLGPGTPALHAVLDLVERVMAHTSR